LSNPEQAATLGLQAREAVVKQSHILDDYLAEIKRYL